MTSKHQQKGSIVNRFLNSVEKIGNKLPDPSVLFFLMCVGLAIMTWVISLFNVLLSIQVRIKPFILKI